MSTTHEMDNGISIQRTTHEMAKEFPDSEYYSRNVLWNFQRVNTTHEMAYGIFRQ